MQDHDYSHDESNDVHTTRGSLEDDRVGKLDIARVAIGLDTDAGRYGSDGTNGCAQRQGRRVAEVGEVTEAGHRVFKVAAR